MRILDYFFASRPLLHLPVWSIYLVCFYYHQELSGRPFGIMELVVPLLLTFVVASAYFLNQIADYQSDMINEKVGFLQNEVVTPEWLWKAATACCLLPLLVAPFVSFWTLVIVAQGIIAAILYSLPPVSLMNRPITGLLVNAYLFGWLVPLAIMPEISIHNSGLLGWNNPLYFFCAVAAIHILTTIPDMDGDSRVGKKTVALLLGANLSRLLALLFLGLSVWLAYQSNYAYLVYVSLLSAIVLLAAIVFRTRQLTLASAKLPIILTTILAGLFYPVYFLFIVVLVIMTRVYYLKRFGIVYPRLG